ncbi:hypothetical protein V6N13_109444 [Hibiscus sabdariffa]
MGSKELDFSKESKAGDRSKLRILLCDNDTKSCEEVFSLLLRCSYQVTSVRSARQVIDALNAEGDEIDIILAEVDLPMSKGMKLLKYVMRNEELRRIPVIMMSAQDEISIVVKCLRLGAVDYLVKPLRTNELLNLWTHMWRRRREFVAAATVEPPQNDSSECRPGVPGTIHQRRGEKWKLECGPMKSELKIGESSAFFTYVKSPAVKSSTQEAATPYDHHGEDHPQSGQQAVNDTQVHENGEAWENCSQGDDFPRSSSLPDSLPFERSASMDFREDKFLVPPRNEPTQSCMNQVMMPRSSQLFQNNLLELQNQASSGVLPQYDRLQHCHSHPHVGGMASFPCYPVNMCMQPGPILTGHSWPSVGNSSSGEVKPRLTVERQH